jgi:hypothetical protein
MQQIYPADFKEWTALLAVLAPLFIGAFAAAWRVMTFYKEWKVQQWKRFQELAAVLFNNKGEHGAWEQMIALREIEAMAVPKAAKASIFGSVEEHVSQNSQSTKFKKEAKNVLLRNSGWWIQRLWYRWRRP